MKIRGPFKDPRKKDQPKRWYLSYFAPRLNDDGTLVLDRHDKPVSVQHRPHCPTKSKANVDKKRIRKQYARPGVGELLFDRKAAEDFATARNIAGPKIPMTELARFWRLHQGRLQQPHGGAARHFARSSCRMHL